MVIIIIIIIIIIIVISSLVARMDNQLYDKIRIRSKIFCSGIANTALWHTKLHVCSTCMSANNARNRTSSYDMIETTVVCTCLKAKNKKNI